MFALLAVLQLLFLANVAQALPASPPSPKPTPITANSAFQCKKFHEIYANGSEMCEKMWGDSFSVGEEPDSLSYVMGYVDSTTNPNFATAELNGKKFTYIDGNRQCGLQYYHYAHAVKQVPGTYANCHQNADSSCCKNTTVSSFAEINLNYGEYYHIDRCGTMSQACQNFFVMEACLYECDPTAGLYRKYTFEEAEANGTNATANNWQMYKMPIKKGFCDQWYLACYDDSFCGGDSGDFFSCSKLKVESDDNTQIIYSDDSPRDRTIKKAAIITIVLTLFFGICLICSFAYVIYRERQGQALFTPLKDLDQTNPLSRVQGSSRTTIVAAGSVPGEDHDEIMGVVPNATV